MRGLATMRWGALGLLTVCAMGCEEFEPPEAGECGAKNDNDVIGGAAVVSPLAFPVRGDITVRGTAQHLGDLTLRSVTVGGERSQPLDGAFNFERWTLTIPFGVLLTQRRDPATNDVILPVRASDSCGYTYTIGELMIPVEEAPLVQVTELDLAVTIPSGRGYLPAEVSAPAAVEVRANPDAAGAPVALKATSGAFTGSGFDTQTVTLSLSSDGTAATATALYEGGGAGAALLTATTSEFVASAPVSVLGPFAMAPAGATLKPGQTIEVSLLGDGEFAELRACTASPTTDVVVYSGDRFDGDLSQGGDLVGAKFTVEVSPDLLEDERVTVSCRDVWGQTVVGVFNATPTL